MECPMRIMFDHRDTNTKIGYEMKSLLFVVKRYFKITNMVLV